MSVDDFILDLPKDEQMLVATLRELLFASEPRFQEKFSYGVPYYFRNRRVCFIWPASAPLGPGNAKVSLGFCYGHLLSNSQGLLLSEGRKQVYIVRFSSLKEIEERLLMEVIQEALMIDDLFSKKSK